MSDPHARSLHAVQALLRRTPRDEFLPLGLKSGVEPHIEGFVRHSLGVSVGVHRWFMSGEPPPEHPDREAAAESLIAEIQALEFHFSEILCRLALAGKIGRLDQFVERRLGFSPEIIGFIQREGGAAVVLDSVPRKLGRVTVWLKDRTASVNQGEIESFSGTLLAAKLILKVIGGDSQTPSMTRS